MHYLMYLWLSVVGRGVQVVRVMSGSFMTSLEMAGVSLSLMRVDVEILRLFGEFSSSELVGVIADIFVSLAFPASEKIVLYDVLKLD